MHCKSTEKKRKREKKRNFFLSLTVLDFFLYSIQFHLKTVELKLSTFTILFFAELFIFCTYNLIRPATKYAFINPNILGKNKFYASFKQRLNVLQTAIKA